MQSDDSIQERLLLMLMLLEARLEPGIRVLCSDLLWNVRFDELKLMNVLNMLVLLKEGVYFREEDLRE